MRLFALDPARCDGVAAKIAAIPPWSAMNYPAGALARFLSAKDDGASRYLIEVEGADAGALSVRFPWLKGPYLELLALLPPFQGRGFGATLINWFEDEAVKLGARNLWVCASSFNEGALRFYTRHGFVPAIDPAFIHVERHVSRHQGEAALVAVQGLVDLVGELGLVPEEVVGMADLFVEAARLMAVTEGAVEGG